MTIKVSTVALGALAVLLVDVSTALAQGRRGGMVGNRGGGASPGFRGSPSFSAPASRPTPRPAMNAPSRPGNINPGNMTRPVGGGADRPNPGGNPGNRPGAGGNPGVRPNPGGNPGLRPNPGGNPGNRPNPGGNPGNRPNPGGIGDRPPFGGIGGNRPGEGNRPNPGGNPGNRPELGGNPGSRPPGGPGPARPPQPGPGGNRPGSGIVGPRPPGGPNRPNVGDNLGVVNRPNVGNRPNIGNNVNRPINSGNTNINRPINNIGNNNVVNRPTNITQNVTNNAFTNVSSNVNNFTNVNRGGYGGGWGGGYGYGGPYGYGGYRPNPYAAYHAGWVNGYWNGHYSSGWGWNNWGMNAMGLGMGIGVASWGIGSLMNTWGYSSFYNPYSMPMTTMVQPATTVVQPVVYDYSRPLDLASAPPAQAAIDQSVASIDSARASFRTGDYAQALKLADLAIQQSPNDPMLHQFRATCLFALGRYDEAAAALYTVLSTGPGWDWTTLAGLYPSIEIYTQQLRSLEAYCKANPQAAAARFLLASLYMTQGSNDAASVILKEVVALQPRDTLSAQLLAALTANPQAEPGAGQDQPSQPAAAPTAVAAQPASEPAAPPNAGVGATPAAEGPSLPTSPVPGKFVGSWTASPAKNVSITITLDQNKGFTWKVADRGRSRQFQGEATFDNDTLALTPPDQPPMVGTVTWQGDAHFQFKAVGAPPNDPGLTFSK
jgi:hypothetical protein